jgi:hypothetical protein
MTRAEFETTIHRLVGLVPERVIYFEIDEGNSRPAWSEDPRFDSLDFGFQLVTTSGDTVNCSWGSEFYQYGITLGVPLNNSSCRAWDASGTSRWSALLGRRIKNAFVIWSWVDNSASRRIQYPQDLKITFEGGREVFVSALEIRPDGFVMGMMDNITVFFDAMVARQFGVGVESPD